MTTGNFFCNKVDDANNGTTWALAKATIQALFNLGDANGNQIYTVGAGQYVENTLVPAYAGASGAWNELIGDTEGNILDGGSNVSGLDPDWMVADGSNATYGLGYNTSVLSSSEKWDRWKIKNIVAQGGMNGFWIYKPSIKVAVELYDSFLWGPEADSFGITLASDSRADDSPSEPHKIIRCMIMGDRGLYWKQGANADFTTNPGLEVQDSIIGSSDDNFTIYLGGAAGYYTYARFKRCLIVQLPGMGYTQIYSPALYNKVVFEDCVFVGYLAPPSGALITYDNCHWYTIYNGNPPPSGVTAHRDGFPFIFGFPLWPYKSLPTGGETSGNDIRGESRATGQVGGLIYIAKKLQQYGILDTSIGAVPAWDASAGGGTGRVGVMRVLGGR